MSDGQGRTVWHVSARAAGTRRGTGGYRRRVVTYPAPAAGPRPSVDGAGLEAVASESSESVASALAASALATSERTASERTASEAAMPAGDLSGLADVRLAEAVKIVDLSAFHAIDPVDPADSVDPVRSVPAVGPVGAGTGLGPEVLAVSAVEVDVSVTPVADPGGRKPGPGDRPGSASPPGSRDPARSRDPAPSENPSLLHDQSPSRGSARLTRRT